MPREPITEPVLDQLEVALRDDRVTDPVDRFTVRAVAMTEGYDDLADFIAAADAVRYTRALELLDQRGD